ncbi:CsbA family protein [Peribacillus sp. FSL H8-0477]|uniref:CsbA family protein n=1 Tax=Peribacillus sp. FSL H8-0477 TaxID=2921388 RepID=UPI0030F9BCE9
MIKLLSALFLPCLLVMLFSRVTYNRYVGLGLTVALIAASAYKGYTHAWWLVIVDALSLTVGFYLSTRMMNRTIKSA